ncbi:Transglutaminase-like enzyme, putative cysteine protease [Hahella chejuensis KCTC 2396]|uniref:Transglutaminase-like enzyme, putative cysteine protease n=1 Tax=Hahella chejuensis (strain KCTC 2396) TaxID=349521 RepID=Q2SIG7_HAHCH|nr:transglutaminase-like domain-containing protein [Hahella chejuensis]ABC29557.1 Transglutaminase-like enzyme, putative cysteine protease [Hahella chejuensis KCTC 2396]
MTQTRFIAVVILPVALALCLGLGAWNGVTLYRQVTAHMASLSSPTKKLIRFQFVVKNKGQAFAKDLSIHLFAPVSDYPMQRLVALDGLKEYKKEVDAISNQTLIYKIDQLASYETRNITVNAEITMLPLAPIIIDPKLWLKNEKYIEVDSPEVREVAKLFEGLPLERQPKAAFDWLAQHLKQSDYIKEEKGAVWALENKTGDCTEYTFAYVAILRKLGIPAIPLGGFIASRPATVISGVDYHNWALFHDGRRWRLADPLNGVFNQQEEDYVAFRVLSESADGEPLGRSRFSVDDENVVIEMQ